MRGLGQNVGFDVCVDRVQHTFLLLIQFQSSDQPLVDKRTAFYPLMQNDLVSAGVRVDSGSDIVVHLIEVKFLVRPHPFNCCCSPTCEAAERN